MKKVGQLVLCADVIVWGSFGFVVNFNEKKKKLKFFAKTIEERQTWVGTIQKALDKFQEKQSSFRASAIDTPQPSINNNLSSSVISPVVETTKSSQSTHKTLKNLIHLFKEALKLESEIFAFPIELETLIPQYYAHLNTNYVSEYDARIQALMQKLSEVSLAVIVLTFQIDSVHCTIRDLIAEEQNGYKLHRIIIDGHADIERLQDWVQQQFPQQHPQYEGAQGAVSPVMQWYTSLTETWEYLLNNTVQM